MQLPDSIKTYFESKQPDDTEGLLAAFTDNAIVEDEGARREGLAAIHAWWTATRRQYQYTAEPFETTGTRNAITVRAVVTGSFPGSPTTLTYRFTLRDRKIARLEIA